MTGRETSGFAELALALAEGREIEFAVKDARYSLTNSRGFWHLCRDTEAGSILLQTVCPFAERDALPAKVAAIKIDGMTIRQIFDSGAYEMLCML